MGIYARGGYGSRGREKAVMVMRPCGGYRSRGREKAVMGMRLWVYTHAGAMEVGAARRLS